ncbi:MAG: M20/M25/M40 family metallo-hydrolase [Acidobacteriota bacterium]|nr:M20/M25/M40 family metallo-hydrolase [Acidobacteriota bacterium]
MTASAAQRRIARLASLAGVHRAFHWLHLHQPQLRSWQMELSGIAAPPFQEEARAHWFLQRFAELGLSNIHLDAEGNALAELQPETPVAGQPCLLLSAHLDTVFPAGTACQPSQAEDSARLTGPGICDNAAGLTGLLAMAAALRYARIVPPVPLVFAANVGEEGEGDLRGMRHLFAHEPYRNRIAAAIALEGAGTETVVTRALGSRRLRVTITGPGGHSWTDAGAPNPILVLCQALSQLSSIPLPATPRTTLNVGHISGGTSVNSIPASATALLDLRSTDPEQLLATETRLRALLASNLAASSPLLQLKIETIGNRPAAALPETSSLLFTVRAVDRHLNLHTEQRIGSTDANIPLALGIPAVALGAGGRGGGIHTLQEWYDPTGRELALRRILLTVLDMLHQIKDASDQEPSDAR